MRDRFRTILLRLGLLQPAISIRNSALAVWLESSDRARVAFADRRHRDLDPGYVHTVVVDRSGGRQTVAAAVRADHRASSVRTANAQVVTQTLAASDVPFRVSAGGDIIVPASGARAAIDALSRARRSLFLTAGADSDTRFGLGWTSPDGQDEVVAFEHHTSAGRTATYGAECGVTIRLGDDDGPSTTAPRPEVDIVYTWVDGADPQWQQQRAAAQQALGRKTAHPDAATVARFRSYDELRYSLRSVERYAEFVRHVYIVTANQTPPWLNVRSNDVTVVDHHDIFPDPAVLPTFNSHSIEACLHRIPGLAEHYLYLNDDFLFVRPVTFSDFFDEVGRAKSFPSSADIPTGPSDKSVDAAAVNVRRAVIDEFDVDGPTTKFKHAPYAQRIAVHREIEARFAGPVAETRSARFRSSTDLSVASALHQHVAPLLDLGVAGRLPGGYVDIGAPHLRERLRRLAANRTNLTICLNDSDAPPESEAARAALVGDFLEAILPGRSKFES